MPPSLFVLGDSISIQYGPYLEQMLQGICGYARKEEVAEGAQTPDYPAGANGGDSSMALAYLRHRFEEEGFAPNMLLLNCGLHDVKTNPKTGRTQVSLADYARNLRQILALMQQRPIKLIWVRTTAVDDARHNSRVSEFHRFNRDVLAFNGAADEIFASAGTPIIDLNRFTANLFGEVYCDHVHFTEPVRAQQAAFIAGYTAATLQSSRR